MPRHGNMATYSTHITKHNMHVIRVLFLALAMVAHVRSFSPSTRKIFTPLSTRLNMIEITKGVEFDTIAREWRLKWSTDSEKKSLQSVQQTLSIFENELKGISGLKSVQRIVCGGCLDYKVIIALDAADFGAWEEKAFAPEENFLNAVKAISGVSVVETQTYTIMPVL